MATRVSCGSDSVVRAGAVTMCLLVGLEYVRFVSRREPPLTVEQTLSASRKMPTDCKRYRLRAAVLRPGVTSKFPVEWFVNAAERFV